MSGPSRTRAADGLCTDCGAKLDDGTWVRHRGILHWIPRGETLATVAARRRYRDARDERYAFPTWWPTATDDSELTCARRLRDALAEADEHDQHHAGETA